MNILRHLTALAALIVFAAPSAAIALTTEQEITPEYVRSHPKEFSVQVARDKNGLIAFTVVFTLSEPRYVVAHLVVRSGDRVLATSDTPAYSKNSENTFYFSVPPECLATSQFTLGGSVFANSGGAAVPLPGTIDYRFRL